MRQRNAANAVAPVSKGRRDMSVPPLPMSPTKWFGRVMEAINAPAYVAATNSLPLEGAALEIGFGTGKVIEILLKRGRYQLVAGIDPTPAMVDFASNRSVIRHAGARVDLRLGSDAVLPWPERSFSVVLALHCFQFWSDPTSSMREVRRVLKPEGVFRLVLREHGKAPPAWLPNPVSRSGDEIGGLRELLQSSGFDCELDIGELTVVTARPRQD